MTNAERFGGSRWANEMIDQVRDGQLPNAQNFLTIALNSPDVAGEILDAMCDEMCVEPQTREDIADMFIYERPGQKDEFLRRL